MASKSIRYYRLEPIGLPFEDGEIVNLTELIKARSVLMKGKPAEIVDDPFDNLNDPNGRANKGWDKWHASFASATWALTGTIPSKDEVKIVREIMRQLPKEFRDKFVDQHFVLSFLPFLGAGFKFHQGSYIHSESNSLRSGISFIEKVYAADELTGYNFFCNHRAPQDTQPYSLADTINLEKADRALNLILGITQNSLPKKKVEFFTYQQTLTARLASSLFPEVVVNYFKKHDIQGLARLVEKHAAQIDELFQKKSDSVCKFLAKPLDEFQSLILSSLINHQGGNWFKMEEMPWESDFVEVELAKKTVPDIRRLMPYYGSENKIFREQLIRDVECCASEQTQEPRIISPELIRQIGEGFLFSQAQTPLARALFEIEFYASWGELCAKQNAIAIGLDRDADFYQYRAWEIGFSRITKDKKPHLLYARRAHPEGFEKLKQLNFRQFWRE